MKKRLLCIVSVFVIMLMLQLLLLFASSLIPNSTIVKNYKKSADYLCEKQVFFNINEDVRASKIDRYADSILLNIAWNIDKNLSSVLMDSYYYTDSQNENDNLHDSVYDGKTANQQYMRYWHGSIIFVRAMHLMFDLKQIYIINAILLIILTVILFVSLIRNDMKIETVSLATGLICVGVWYVPLSLEYTWTFIVMMITTIIVVHLHENDFLLMIVFLLSGMITNYLDFLTTETITLLVPLLIVISTSFKNISKKSSGYDKKADYKWIFALSVSWAIGYIGNWIMKWVITAVVTGENVIPLISGHIEERLNGEINNMSIVQYMIQAVGRNISCLFPLGYGTIGFICAIVLILGYLYVCYVYHESNISSHIIIIYLLIALVPIVRYMILHNHAYLHCFFTYRALLPTIMALCFIAAEIIDGRYIGNAILHRRKS